MLDEFIQNQYIFRMRDNWVGLTGTGDLLDVSAR